MKSFFTNCIGKEIIEQYIDEHGAWIMLADRSIVKLDNSEIDEEEDYPVNEKGDII